jgi:peroxiredoxin Q/BCP
MTIIGISPDPIKKQGAFVEKQKLNVSYYIFRKKYLYERAILRQFPILSDEKREVANAYDVGTGMLGLVKYSRTTFIIDGKGIIR